LGLLKIVEETKLDKKIAKLLSPVIDFLMGETDSKTKNYIAINLTSNLLGMGNASTPSGIEGMAGLDKGSKYITTAMAMFFILNVTSLQLIPTTIISLRALHGSLNSNDIILPTLISTIASTLTGIILVKMCKKLFKKGDNNE
jgi:spore maturation protein A